MACILEHGHKAAIQEGVKKSHLLMRMFNSIASAARSCFQYVHPDIVPLHDERIIAVRGVQLHRELYQRDVTNGTQSLHTEPLR